MYHIHYIAKYYFELKMDYDSKKIFIKIYDINMNFIEDSAFIYFDPILNDGNLSGYMIKGGGYGHGVGMSQNAVSKMVETMNYRQILEFFYKGTNIETVY